MKQEDTPNVTDTAGTGRHAIEPPGLGSAGELDTAPVEEADAAPDAATRLLDAAESVFADVGFAGATTAAIAERAGVTKALVHYYYRSKESLHAAVLERSKGRLADLILHDLEHEAPLAAIRSATRRYCRFLADNPRYVRLCLYNALEGNRELSDSPTHRKLMEVTTAALERGMASGTFRRDFDPTHLIITIVSLCAHYFEHESALSELGGVPTVDRETRVTAYIDHVVRVLELALVDAPQG